MSRAPFQVLVFPYRRTDLGQLEYAIFRRSGSEVWQGIAGGGEGGETSLDAAKREAWEEAGLPADARYVPLDSMTTIPVLSVVGSFLWGSEVYVIPEYSFGVRADKCELVLSREHTEYRWVRYEEAERLLKWDSNRTALWELNQRLICQVPVPSGQ